MPASQGEDLNWDARISMTTSHTPSASEIGLRVGSFFFIPEVGSARTIVIVPVIHVKLS